MAESMDLKKLKIPELKKELTSRGLALMGKKQELVSRLAQYLEENGEVLSVGIDEKSDENPPPASGDESILDNGTEPSDLILAQEVEEEEEELLDQEDEPSLLDDEEEEPAAADKVVSSDSEEQQQQRTVIAAPTADPAQTASAAPKITVASAGSVASLTLAQKKAMRAERFNTPLTEDAKKQARLEKFGGKAAATATTEVGPKAQAKATVSAEALEKMKKRSERFGTNVSPVVQKTEEMDRLLKRKQRFGVITNTEGVRTTGVRKLSTEGSESDKEAKKRRAERFGLSA